ncbi:MAG TPA: GFA family protein [Allosphingosinicella sp.]|jgi:hypothetical protein
MNTRKIQCHCGGLWAECRGEPVRISVCHCLACKARTGAAFAYTATFMADAVTTDGAPSVYERRSDEGFWAREYFCPHCGTKLWYEIERRPGMISIPAGAFADPKFPPPTVEVYTNRRQIWLAALPGVEQN